MPVRIMAATDRGLKRSHNEDRYGARPLNDEDDGALLIVADGMGGARGGEVASRLVVEAVMSRLETGTDGRELEILREAVETANARVYRESQEREGLEGMGATCTAAVLDSRALWLAHVGDSRAYLVRRGRARQLTRDHSLVSELVGRGELTAEEARKDPRRNIVLRSVGVNEHVQVDVQRADFEPHPGDTVLLCTDGLHGLVTDGEIGEIAGGSSLDDACRQLIALACDRGGPDNITVVLARFDGEPIAEIPPASDVAAERSTFRHASAPPRRERAAPVFAEPPSSRSETSTRRWLILAAVMLALVVAFLVAVLDRLVLGGSVAGSP